MDNPENTEGANKMDNPEKLVTRRGKQMDNPEKLAIRRGKQSEQSRETGNTKGQAKWTIQRNWQHMVHKTKKNQAKTQHNMCWTPL